MYKTRLRAETIRRFKIFFPIVVVAALLVKGFGSYQDFKHLNLGEFQVPFEFILSMLALTFLNLSFETKKWTSLFEKIDFWPAMSAVIIGIKAGFVTPNRVGEFAGRNSILPRTLRNEAGLMTIVGAFIQGTVTFVFGLVSLVLVPEWMAMSSLHIDVNGVIISLGILILGSATAFFFRHKFANHIKDFKLHLRGISGSKATRALVFAILRYAVFSFQFYYCLYLCGFEGGYITALAGISAIYFIQSFIPFAALGELGVRELLAVLILGVFMPEPWMAALATLILWCFNLLVPVSLGLIFGKYINKLRLGNS